MKKGKKDYEGLFDADVSEQEAAEGHVIRVAFESGADAEFDYLVPEKLWPVMAGQLVEVPFGRSNKAETGFCVLADVPRGESYGGGRLKEVRAVVDKAPLIDEQLLDLARWISSYYVCPLGQVLGAMVPSAVKKGIGVKKQKFIYLARRRREDVTSDKQAEIISLLRNSKALAPESALELKGVLEQVGCTEAPVKRLIEKLVVKVTQRTVLKSLPAIPEGLSLKTESVRLNEDQRNALEHIGGQIESGRFGVTVLHGVTDSGKTEVYIRAIEKAMEKGKSAIVLLPEIALTAQTVQRFSSRFGRIAVMHSGLTAAQRNGQWQAIKNGYADVVIGARSAVFAPLSNVGLIVVDEEHESSYKQDTAPRYNGRDVAIKRASACGAHCVLGSATPSLETLHNCRTKKHYALVRLPKRVMDLPMPEMRLVDMRYEHSAGRGASLISEPLGARLHEILGRKEQAILLLNRRGYSNFVYCPSCRHTLRCRNCDVTVTFHKSRTRLAEKMRTVTGKHLDYGYAMCHHCLAETLVPEVCPLCGGRFAMLGMGSQRLEEELKQKFPEARTARIDSDSMQGQDYYRLLKDFADGRIDILAGTQMLAKGLHFPNVTVVGIISADTSLYAPDFRTNERTFQLISQVAGRTGRSEKKGTVFVQTLLAEQAVIKYAMKNDYGGFVAEEMKHRKACSLPPCWRMAAVLMRDTRYEKLEAAATAMRQRLDFLIEHHGLGIKVRGPMPACISRIQTFHRMHIILQAAKAEEFLELFRKLRAAGSIRPAVKIAIDVDPVNLL